MQVAEEGVQPIRVFIGCGFLMNVGDPVKVLPDLVQPIEVS